MYRIFKRSFFSLILFFQCVLVFFQLTMLLAHLEYFDVSSRFGTPEHRKEEQYLLSWIVDPADSEQISEELKAKQLQYYDYTILESFLNNGTTSESIVYYGEEIAKTLKFVGQPLELASEQTPLYVDHKLSKIYKIGDLIDVEEVGNHAAYVQATVAGYLDTTDIQIITSESNLITYKEREHLFAISEQKAPRLGKKHLHLKTIEVPFSQQGGLTQMIEHYRIEATELTQSEAHYQLIQGITYEKDMLFLVVYIIGLSISLLFMMKQEFDIYRRLLMIKVLVGAKYYRIAFGLIAPFVLIALVAYGVVGLYFTVMPIKIYMAEQNYFSYIQYGVVGIVSSLLFFALYLWGARQILKSDVKKGLNGHDD